MIEICQFYDNHLFLQENLSVLFKYSDSNAFLKIIFVSFAFLPSMVFFGFPIYYFIIGKKLSILFCENKEIKQGIKTVQIESEGRQYLVRVCSCAHSARSLSAIGYSIKITCLLF
jgi:hypothetical protein